MKTSLVTLLIAIGLGSAHAADSICVPKNNETPLVTLQRINSAVVQSQCLGREKDTSDTARSIWDPSVKLPAAEDGASKLARMHAVITNAQSQLAQLLPMPAASNLQSALDQADKLFAQQIPPHPPRELLKANTWQLVTAPGPYPAALYLSAADITGVVDVVVAGTDGALSAACLQDTSQICRAQLVQAEVLATIGNRMQLALSTMGESLLPAVAERLSIASAEWHAYFNDARSQTPIELLVNDYFFRHSADFRNTQNGPVAQLAPAPTRQFILFHPNAGVEYVGSADPGSRFKPALFMELAGYNRWSYSSKDGSMGNALGGSLIVSYTDRAGARDVGYGAVFHVNNKYSLALTYRRGSSVGIMFSSDLQSLLTKYSSETQMSFQNGTYGSPKK